MHEQCDYDAYLLTVMHMTIDIGDGPQQYLARQVGTGILSVIVRAASSCRAMAVGTCRIRRSPNPRSVWNGTCHRCCWMARFELDGRVTDEGDSLDVKLSFLPPDGPPVFHGVSICVYENGDVGEGWSTSSGGDASLAAQINSTYPLDGGSNQVEMEGKGLQMVAAQSQLDYQAVLTIIPR